MTADDWGTVLLVVGGLIFLWNNATRIAAIMIILLIIAVFIL